MYSRPTTHAAGRWSRAGRWSTRASLATALAAATLGLSGVDSSAAPATVTTEAELRAAFADPNQSEIVLGADIDLTDCDAQDMRHDSATELRIAGEGHTIRQTCDQRQIFILGGTEFGGLTIENLTLTGGSSQTSGGAISASGPVTVVRSTLTGNVGSGGGAIYSSDSIEIIDSELSDNRSYIGGGGAIRSDADVTITDSSLIGNEANSNGGAINAETGVEVTASTLADNTAREAGGAIYSYAGAVTIDEGSVLDGNTATLVEGGAIYATDGQVIVRGGSTLSSNSAGTSGGGIFAAGSVTVSDGSTVTGNSATQDGGGIHTSSGEMSVTASTLDGNTAEGSGGAIFAGEAVSATNATLTGNAAGVRGGAIAAVNVDLLHATVVANTAPAGANLAIDGTTGLTTFGSVLAEPDGGANCELAGPTPQSGGYNLADDGSCDLTHETDDSDSEAPGLGELADNGGPAKTLQPALDSPLVDAIPSQRCHPSVPADQRGIPRPQLAGCDIGAVEIQHDRVGTTVRLTVKPRSVTGDEDVTLTATVEPEAYVGGADPTGTVEFFDRTSSLGAAELGSPATLTVSDLSVGRHRLTARYAGDASYAASRSQRRIVTVSGSDDGGGSGDDHGDNTGGDGGDDSGSDDAGDEAVSGNDSDDEGPSGILPSTGLGGLVLPLMVLGALLILAGLTLLVRARWRNRGGGLVDAYAALGMPTARRTRRG